MIDSHAHLEMAAFDGDREAVIARAAAAGLTAVVTVGTSLAEAEKAVALAGRHRMVYAAVGIHPHEAGEMGPAAGEALARLARREKVVALGETGLDFFYDHAPREVQRRCFGEQLDLAAALDLPVIVHDRDAHAETLAMLTARRGRLRGVLHCFSGDAAMAARCLDLGFFLSVAGPLTYPKATALREVVRAVPLERLLVETDCPYLAPQRYRGQRNEPAYVRETAAALAALKGLPAGVLAAATAANARRLFGIGAGETVDGGPGAGERGRGTV